ncbi:unnamed protein product [Spodoptera exigua]|nr:unnamed protein product [Spodoptera exigua]
MYHVYQRRPKSQFAQFENASYLEKAANKKPWRYQPEPEFWRDQPRLWFKQLEAIVAPQKQGDDYKYYTVIAKLPKEEIIQVSDLITCPPPIEKYKAIKERLISCYEESDQRQLQKLLSEMDLGDQKPSHLLRKMRTLSNGNISDETIKLLWLRLLPPSVTSVLAVTEDIDVNKMSQIADKILINSTRTETKCGRAMLDTNGSAQLRPSPTTSQRCVSRGFEVQSLPSPNPNR